jgi:hypothetical protein
MCMFITNGKLTSRIGSSKPRCEADESKVAVARIDSTIASCMRKYLQSYGTVRCFAYMFWYCNSFSL